MAESGARSGAGPATLTVPGPDGATQLAALRRWLTSTQELRGRVDWQRKPPEPGQMGGALDVLGVVLGDGGLLALLTPLCTWLLSRRGTVSVVVERDGRRVEVDVKRAADPVAVARELLSALEEQSGGE